MSEIDKVNPAKLSWREDELGNLVPVSEVFGDVYYSLANGLAESRYVFLQQNNLPERFTALFEQYLASFDTENGDSGTVSVVSSASSNSFTIAELGFGTGLNILVTWQLWQQTKQQVYSASSIKHSDTENGYQHPRLHLISTEKHPLTLEDLTRSLQSWQDNDPSLIPFITRLLALYPTLVSGCHRLHLEDDVTLDLWLGDATQSLQKLASSYSYLSHQTQVDAWYLDGFAPSCNESLWAEQIFEQVQRLSKPGSTAATFSCAGVVKRGLEGAGFDIKKVKGFGRKREMLTASKRPNIFNPINPNNEQPITGSDVAFNPKPYKQVAVIGAGISGLMSAWSLAQRGLTVTLIDKTAPLAGASGNPRALLAPKMTPIAHVAEHLHSIGYLYSQRLYRQLDQRNLQQLASSDTDQSSALPRSIFTGTGTVDLLLKSNVDVSQIAEYPSQMATTFSNEQACALIGLKQQNLANNLYLPQAGLVNPKALAETILTHPNISFEQAQVKQIKPYDSIEGAKANAPRQYVQLEFEPTVSGDYHPKKFDAVIIAAAFDSKNLDARIFEFRRIRGQLSWFQPTKAQLEALPKVPLKYGGYCAAFTPCPHDEQLNPVSVDRPTFLLGASFVRNDMSTEIRPSEHQVNRHKLMAAIPELECVLTTSINSTFENEDEYNQANEEGWQARVGIRAQTPDYHPLVGQVDDEGLIWTLSGMGSKGYAFAPICAEVLADMMTGQYTPLPSVLLDKLSPHRASLQKPLSK